MSPPAQFTNTPSEPVVLVGALQLQRLITEAVKTALCQQHAEHQAARRLTTKEAAAFLGRSTYYLQELHKQGLPYEKGRPNFYKLADLERFQESRRLHHQ